MDLIGGEHYKQKILWTVPAAGFKCPLKQWVTTKMWKDLTTGLVRTLSSVGSEKFSSSSRFDKFTGVAGLVSSLFNISPVLAMQVQLIVRNRKITSRTINLMFKIETNQWPKWSPASKHTILSINARYARFVRNETKTLRVNTLPNNKLPFLGSC